MRQKIIFLLTMIALLVYGEGIINFFTISLVKYKIKYSNNINTKFINAVLWHHINKIDAKTIYNFLSKSQDLASSENLIARCVAADRKDIIEYLVKLQKRSSKDIKLSQYYVMCTSAIVALKKDMLVMVPLCHESSNPYEKKFKVYMAYRNEVSRSFNSIGGELEEIAEKIATKYSRKQNDGTYFIAFNSPYYYGDYVNFNSPINGKGTGYIEAITVDEDGCIDYLILLDDASSSKTIIGGIRPEDIISLKVP